MSDSFTALKALLLEQAQVSSKIRQHRVAAIRSRVNKTKPKYKGKAKPLIDEMDRRLLKAGFHHDDFDELLNDIEQLLE